MHASVCVYDFLKFTNEQLQFAVDVLIVIQVT